MKGDIGQKLLVLFLLVLLGTCGSPERNVSGGDDRYQVPASPPKSLYRIDGRIDLETGVVAGNETITFQNSSTIPLTTIAPAWTISERKQFSRIRFRPVLRRAVITSIVGHAI